MARLLMVSVLGCVTLLAYASPSRGDSRGAQASPPTAGTDIEWTTQQPQRDAFRTRHGVPPALYAEMAPRAFTRLELDIGAGWYQLTPVHGRAFAWRVDARPLGGLRTFEWNSGLLTAHWVMLGAHGYPGVILRAEHVSQDGAIMPRQTRIGLVNATTGAELPARPEIWQNLAARGVLATLSQHGILLDLPTFGPRRKAIPIGQRLQTIGVGLRSLGAAVVRPRVARPATR